MEITTIKVNGIVYDIADKEAVEALNQRLTTEVQRMDATAEQLSNAINAESARAGMVEGQLGDAINGVKNTAARVDGNQFVAKENEVQLITTGVDISKQHPATLPAATTEKAGVMSAEDKVKLDSLSQGGGGDVTTEQLNEVKADVRANATAINDEVARATQAELDAIEKGRQLALRALFVAAGAEYNDTDNHIVKYTPWKDYVDSNEYMLELKFIFPQAP